MKPADEIEKLKTEIRKHDYLYYVLASPEISDYEYDKLVKRLEDLEKIHPELVSPDSPTMRVSGQVTDEFKSVTHAAAMLSLSNTYVPEEILEWQKRAAKALPEENFEYIIEPKIDGVSCSLTYKNGALALGATRGDGLTGEDITLNIKTIKSVPLKLFSDMPFLELRGEIYIDRKDFDLLNESLLSSGEEAFANPRNASAGSLRQKNPAITARRRLKFMAHSYGAINGGKIFDSHKEFLEFCTDNGLPSTLKYIRITRNITEVLNICAEYEKTRLTFPFEIDGLVIKINDLSQQRKLGFTMKSPRWAAAYKFPAKQVTTLLKNIIIQVGRTGILTPVAELEPVECGGVIISRATLHNFDEIKRLDVRAGDTVLVERAGEVIPKIIKVINTKRIAVSMPFEIPSQCPVCGRRVEKEKNEDVALRCVNPLCPAQIERGLTHFASRAAMDIEGLGDAAVEQLIKKKIVSDFADIYFLEKRDLLGLDLFKDKKADNLIFAIQKSKDRPLSRLLFGLGIRNIGEKAALLLAGQFRTMEALMNANADDITKIYEMGPIMAESIVKFFQQDETVELIRKLKKAGVNMEEHTTQVFQKFAGKTFVFTGELKTLSRVEAETAVRGFGGNATASVSKKTDFVVAGEKPGSKYDKAKKLGIPIIMEQDFLKMIK
ncbi:MAG: DNA ligase [Elusimicrobia bacterium ADurb.Bin231]|nr:MAG: DNA ligase [Elusimicrobia bacterium ADurb.Bin231]